MSEKDKGRGEHKTDQGSVRETPVESTYEREDARWKAASQARDWLILLIIGVIWASWMLIVYFLEPGIR